MIDIFYPNSPRGTIKLTNKNFLKQVSKYSIFPNLKLLFDYHPEKGYKILLHQRREKSTKETKEIFHLKQYINTPVHKMIVVLLCQANRYFQDVQISEYLLKLLRY